MNAQLPFGLRLVFIISAIAATLYGVGAIVAPKFVADLSGLPGQDLPVYQQAGALSLGPALISILALRATTWDQVRIATAGLFVNVLLSAIGAFFYVVLQGVVSPALVVILVYTVYASIAFGYYLWVFRGRRGG